MPIYLVRHGESVVNVEQRLTCRKPEGDLTDLGREQAALAAEWLLDKQITAIRHSPFHRAEQTAKIIGERLGLPLIVDDDLREMDCGDLEGRSDDAGWDLWRGVFDRWMAHDSQAAFPGGESFADARQRFSRALERATDPNTLFVTHGGITMTVVPALCVNAADLMPLTWLKNTSFVVLKPVEPGCYTGLSWNFVEHLDE